MISRIWKGNVPMEKKESYLQYIRETGLEEYARTPGNLGAYLLIQDQGDECEFMTLSFWDSVESIRGFAGEDYEAAKYYPEDEAFLVDRVEKVDHHEVVFCHPEAPTLPEIGAPEIGASRIK